MTKAPDGTFLPFTINIAPELVASPEVLDQSNKLLHALDKVEAEAVLSQDATVNFSPLVEWKRAGDPAILEAAVEFTTARLRQVVDKPDKTSADFEDFSRASLRIGLIHSFRALGDVRFVASHYGNE